jgi:pimeloyl-ACP methyl ester carboxylesterase
MRAPTRSYWGWNAEEAKRIRVPTLVMLGEFDELNASNKDREQSSPGRNTPKYSPLPFRYG